MALGFQIRRRLRLFPLLQEPPPTILAALRPISAAASPSLSTQPDPKLSLSARLSFVFEQIDALERQRDISGKDEALQRIRSWRQSKHPPPPSPSMATVDGGGSGIDAQMTEGAGREKTGMAEIFRREVEVVHPWPEWIELMERLSIQNYFDYRRVEEDRVAANAGIDLSGVKEEVGLDLTRDWAAVKTACMNFGKDRFDILKFLSRKDIQTLVGHGCPSMDPKVVFSAKLLRKYVRVDEGDVCSSCSLRNTCSRGYILVPKEDEARTLDVMRILLTYGFDHVKESVENNPLRKMKSVKNVVRRLLHEVVKLSAVPRDPNLLPPLIKKLPPKVKQPPPQPKRRVGRDDVEMKKGDWLCSKCDFMNFAKNIVCLQCDAKRPKRQLLPGEWECPKCNFLNYRRNMSCFQCEHTRPPDEFTENQMQGKQRDPTTRFQRAARTSDVSNAWNFDFDDDESDGADVAAFEFADSTKSRDGSSLDELPRGGRTRDFEDDKTVWNQDRGQYVCNPGKASSSSHSGAAGFDDFDDEEDDNVDNYELDEANCKETHAISRKGFSVFENDSESENSDDLDKYDNANQYRKDYLSNSYDDDDIVVSARNIEHEHKSFDSGNVKGPVFYSPPDMHDNYDRKQTKTGKKNTGQKGSSRKTDFDFDDELLSSDVDDEDENLFSSSSKKKGNSGAPDRIARSSKDSNNFGLKNNGRNSFVHDQDEDDLFSRSNKKKGIRGASERRGHSLKNSNHSGSKHNGRNSFVHDEDGDDDLCTSRNWKKGNKGASERIGRRFQDYNHFGPKNNGRNSFAHCNDDKVDDWRGSNLRNRGKQSSYGARGFQRTRMDSKGNDFGKWNDDDGYKRSARMADNRKFDYSHR